MYFGMSQKLLAQPNALTPRKSFPKAEEILLVAARSCDNTQLPSFLMTLGGKNLSQHQREIQYRPDADHDAKRELQERNSRKYRSLIVTVLYDRRW
jgi:hypothetical protein